MRGRTMGMSGFYSHEPEANTTRAISAIERHRNTLLFRALKSVLYNLTYLTQILHLFTDPWVALSDDVLTAQI